MTAEQFRDAVTFVPGIEHLAPLAEVIPSESDRKRFRYQNHPCNGFGTTIKRARTDKVIKAG